MNKRKEKKQQLESLKPKKYRIYGIFDFAKKKLIHVGLTLEDVEFEFDLGKYNSENCDIVSFNIMIA